MRALILEQNAKERSLIQHVLEKSGHAAILGKDMDQAWQLIEKGEARFVIADGDAEDFKKSNLIGRGRAAKILPVYFLILTAGEDDDAEADDNLHKPIVASELKARIMIGQRFLLLGESLSRACDQLESLALYDSLTGLMNRNAFFRSAQGELERARRSSSPLTMIALDLDRFKNLNAEHGADMGDEVLKIIAQIIREKCRPYDCIGRWTGDEFVIALPGVIGADAEKIAERIIKTIDAANITYKNDAVKVGLSAGIVSASRISASAEVEPLIEQARQAMMRAKESGGDQVYLTYI